MLLLRAFIVRVINVAMITNTKVGSSFPLFYCLGEQK